MPEPSAPETHRGTARRHLAFGWTMLAVFIVGGLGLEALHGFKAGFYLDVGMETRRTMWRLAHAHGALLAGVNLAFAWTLTQLDWDGLPASKLLLMGSLLVPAGFFLGGVWIHGGDPGVGVVLTPVGALLLLAAVVLTARRARAKPQGQ